MVSAARRQYPGRRQLSKDALQNPGQEVVRITASDLARLEMFSADRKHLEAAGTDIRVGGSFEFSAISQSLAQSRTSNNASQARPAIPGDRLIGRAAR